jgi:hypothetical protein
MKRLLLCLALLVSFVPSLFAQGNCTVISNCLFNGIANGCTYDYLEAENTPCNPNGNQVAEVLAPFTVPLGQSWTITGAFSNDFTSNGGVLDPAKCYWGIFTGVSNGVGGTMVASGVQSCTFVPVGVHFQNRSEFTAAVRFHGPTLGPGTYFLSVQPTCINGEDQACTAQFFEADAENTLENGTQGPLLNAFGPPEPEDNSFFESTAFELNYFPTWFTDSTCAPASCDAFSDGLTGTCTGTGCPN